MPECHVFAIFAVQSEVAVLFGNLKFIMHVSFMSDHTDSWISSLSNQMCTPNTADWFRYFVMRVVDMLHLWQFT